MNRDEVIAIARKAGFTEGDIASFSDLIVHFAALVISNRRQHLDMREIELLDGMIEYELKHAERCDGIANSRMARWQKSRDLERAALLQKLKTSCGTDPSK